MSTNRLILAILVLVIGCKSRIVANVGADPAVPAPQEPAAGGPVELDPQLELARDALLDKGSSDQMRVNAAAVLLSSQSPPARKILLDASRQNDNDAVSKALCRALIQARSGVEPLRDANDFVGPLLGLLGAENPTTARLAAEATLIFEYDRISEPLGKLIADASVPQEARLNAIYALELHPDLRAAVALLELVDSAETNLAVAAQRALVNCGIPVGSDAASRAQIAADLVSQGAVAFLRRRLIRKEAQIRSSKAELALWQSRYLSALGDVYATISDDKARAGFLGKYLGASDTAVRVWALEKIRQDRVGTRPNPELLTEVGSVLVSLVADSDGNVRLKAASVLSLMGEVNSAQHLLAQLEVEQEEQVRTVLLDALGRACYLALLPDSKVKIAPEIRQKTLGWAAEFLSEEDPDRARRGAEVMRMLLEQDGLSSAEVEGYFALLAERYGRVGDDSRGSLRGELLSAMAGLCAPQSAHKVQAQKQFGPLFESALTDKTDLVREAAVDGLIYIDKGAALKRLRKDFTGDPSVVIRTKLIALADEVGGKEDIPWLSGKIGSNSESEPAWRAMLKIFNGADAAVLGDWVDTFAGENSASKASDAQKITFFELAERKAVAQDKPKMLATVLGKLARLYVKTGQYERAADCLGRLHDAAVTEEAKRAILPDLLGVYLRWPKTEQAASLVESCLLKGDLDPNDAIVRSIDEYMATPPAGADPNLVLKALAEIKTPQARPLWRKRLGDWALRLGKAKGAANSEQGGT